jgi:hypothetical protein
MRVWFRSSMTSLQANLKAWKTVLKTWMYQFVSSIKLPKCHVISLRSLYWKGTLIFSRWSTPPPLDCLEGVVASSSCKVRRQGSPGGWVATLIISLGWKGESGFLWAKWECLRGIPFSCVFTNHGEGLSTSLTLFHAFGWSLRKKNSARFLSIFPPSCKMSLTRG